jgi:hypothetical protein
MQAKRSAGILPPVFSQLLVSPVLQMMNLRKWDTPKQFILAQLFLKLRIRH